MKVSPVYLHQDKRITSMLFLNMVALLAYSLLERQVRQAGLALTTRQIIRRLETLMVIETHCHDGSCLRRLTPIEPEIARNLHLVAAIWSLPRPSTDCNKAQILLTNAIKYATFEGQITVSAYSRCKSDVDWCGVSISDTGRPGIVMDELAP